MERLERVGVAVPPIIDSDLDTDRPWFVMPWYRAGSLEAAIDRRSGPADVVAELGRLRQLADILSLTHTASIAHRDLKPANVLLEDDRPLLADFGLCLELAEEGARLTTTEEAVGSRHYIAPENEGGLNDAVDQRPCDFYAYGKLTWALLTGERLPPREQLLEGANRLSSRLNDHRLSPLDELLRDLLNRDPRARLDDWRTVSSDLAAVRFAYGNHRVVEPQLTSRNLTRLARRLRSSPTVSVAHEGQEARQRRAGWLNRVLLDMTQEAQLLNRRFDDLNREFSDMLTVQVTTGGPPDPAILSTAGLLPRIPPGQAFADLHPGTAVCYVIHSPSGLPLPSLVIRLWPTTDGKSVSVIRVPTITRFEEREEVASFLVDSVFTVSGPWPAFRERSMLETRSVAGATSELFASIAEHYLQVAAADRDVADASAWADFSAVP